MARNRNDNPDGAQLEMWGKPIIRTMEDWISSARNLDMFDTFNRYTIRPTTATAYTTDTTTTNIQLTYDTMTVTGTTTNLGTGTFA
jgi:hypothetical protein